MFQKAATPDRFGSGARKAELAKLRTSTSKHRKRTTTPLQPTTTTPKFFTRFHHVSLDGPQLKAYLLLAFINPRHCSLAYLVTCSGQAYGLLLPESHYLTITAPCLSDTKERQFDPHLPDESNFPCWRTT